MKNSNKNILIAVFLFGSFLLIKSFVSIFEGSRPSENLVTQLEEVSYEPQYKIEKQPDSSTHKKLKRAEVLRAQTKFKFKKKNRPQNLRRQNIAQAPQNSSTHNLNTNSDSKNQKVSNNNVKESRSNKTGDTDKDGNTDGDEDEDEDKKKLTKKEDKDGNDEDDKDSKTDEESSLAEKKSKLDPNFESQDLALLNNNQVEDTVTYTTTSVPQSNRSNSNNDSNSNSGSNGGSDESDSDDINTFTFDPETTATFLETLLSEGNYSAINVALSEGSIDRDTTYYQIISHYSQSSADRDDITNLLNTHFLNIESVNLLASHLVDEETSLPEKQISYVYLTEIINTWPLESGSQEFNAIFVDGVNQRLSGPLDGDLSPQQELYLQLSETILTKLDEINSLTA